jgi:hypothetical protein
MSEGGSFGEQGSLGIGADEGAPTGAEAPQDPGEAQAQLDALQVIPSSAAGYDLNSFEVPEVLKEVWDQDLQDGVIAEMHKLGLTNAQVRGILGRYAESQSATFSEYLTESGEAAADERADAQAGLRREWGSNYEGKLATAKETFVAAAKAAGVDVELLAGSTTPDGRLIGDNPDLVRVFAALGEGLGQASPGVPGGPVYASSLADLDAQLAEIEGDPALHDKRDPRHAMVMLQRTLLFQQRYPEEQPTSTPPRDTSREAITKRKRIAKAAAEELKGPFVREHGEALRKREHRGHALALEKFTELNRRTSLADDDIEEEHRQAALRRCRKSRV